MPLINRALKKQAQVRLKESIQEVPAKDHKRAVTLYLDREKFALFQNIYGRRTSQAIDELIEAVISGDRTDNLRAAG